MYMGTREIARLEKIDAHIQSIKKAALELNAISGGIQALDCNTQRILASVKMLEINFSDLRDLVAP
jgi:cell division protein FtsI/penicillin-binding protein 2